LRVMAEAADEAKARGWVAEVKAMAAGLFITSEPRP
jgi:hypothetical protein